MYGIQEDYFHSNTHFSIFHYEFLFDTEVYGFVFLFKNKQNILILTLNTTEF